MRILFFLPAYQISTHENMSADAKGFYCHFDMEIFNSIWMKPDMLAEFPFLQFNGSPLIHEYPKDEWVNMINVNLIGTYYL